MVLDVLWYFQALVAQGIRCSMIEVPDTDHFSVIENLQNDDYVLTKVSIVENAETVVWDWSLLY